MKVELQTLPGIPFVQKGDDLVTLIEEGYGRAGDSLQNGDIIVLAQKIVSKAEGRTVALADVTPSGKAIELARRAEKDPRLVELILSEAAALYRADPKVIVAEHRLGFTMANAGIDQSNVEDGHALLLPVDPDASARAIRERLKTRHHVLKLGVIINDSVSRPWRNGICGIAIGSAGLPVVNDLRGRTDMLGRELKHTLTGFVDEISAAASLLMGQAAEGTPVVIVRGLEWLGSGSGVAGEVLRPSELTPDHVTRV